ncbi:MAG: UDP-N-acetylmuramoyl-L-alanine--D-glutamate ligase, partial [Clostridia bacterium]|nr:UDP-N-acetylmuramoyl-L-alanine--D-glutamate ligase [Clostridia bacterium]
MTEKITEYYNSIKGKKITFIGIGVTNRPLIKKFAKLGAIVTACDKCSMEDLGDEGKILTDLGVTLNLGENYLENLEGDIIFRTPGLNYNHPKLKEAREKGIIVTSEMEVFFDICPAKIYAVTGSDGKTTTTTLVSEFLKAQGKKVYLGGNIGTPLLPLVDDMEYTDCAVVELSSFQLMSMKKSPDVAVITNIAPNHLDVHKDMDEYVEAKENLIKYQKENDITVLNNSNEYTLNFAKKMNTNVRMFTRIDRVENGAFCDEKGDIYFAQNGNKTLIMNKQDIRLPGLHNVENYLAAICAVGTEVSAEVIKNVAQTFGGVEHRIEFVRELDGVKWYNDSIATSPTRAIAGLLAFDKRLIIIAGGYDKHIPFEPFAECAVDH